MGHREFEVRHIKIETSVNQWAMPTGAVRVVDLKVRKAWEWISLLVGVLKSTKSRALEGHRKRNWNSCPEMSGQGGGG